MRDYAKQILVDMLKIYSPSGEEAELSNFILDKTKEFGFFSEKDNVGNVITRMGQGEPKLLLCGHMDTVPGKIDVRMEGNKLYGRGSVDAKSSIAAMMMAMNDLKKNRLSGELILACVVDEEGEGKGIRNLIEKGIKANYAVFGEPSGTCNITIGYKGSLHLRVTIKTESGHPSAPWLFENAIEKAIEIWKLIKNHHLPEENLDSRFYSSSYCLVKLSGGSSLNITPSFCEFDVDIRIPPQLTPEQVYESLMKKIELLQSNKSTIVEVKSLGKIEPFETEKNSQLVKAFSWSIRKVRKDRVTLLRKTGTADINELSLKYNIPMIAYGPGDSHLDHTSNEHIVIDDYFDSIEIYREAILRLFELDEKRRNNE
jgi:LysW-gamma-L-lysine carboxypeptidase